MPHPKHPNNLRFYRLKRKLTQKEVSDYLGHASANRLSTWENGTASPAIHNLIKLGELYRVSIDTLVVPLTRKIPKPKATIPSKKKVIGEENPYADMNTEQLIENFAEIIFDSYLYHIENDIPLFEENSIEQLHMNETCMRHLKPIITTRDI